MERTITAEKAIELAKGFAMMTLRQTANLKYTEETNADWGYLNLSSLKRLIKNASKEELEELDREMIEYAKAHQDMVSRRCTSIVRDNIVLSIKKEPFVYERTGMIV